MNDLFYRQSDNGHLHYVINEEDKIVKVYWSKQDCIDYLLGKK